MDRAECEKRVGSTLSGKWKLEKLLGVGGMAAAYVAVHRIGRREAIKILHPEMARSPSIRARLEREARAANLVQHPAIVPIRDVDTTDDGLPFLVMDLLEGEPLSQRIARSGHLESDDVAGWIADVLDALAIAHQRGIVHRDIKPDNLFVETNGKIRLLDFGIAKMDSTEGDGIRTRSGVTIGTASYMPPEQIRGGTVDGRADLFAVGATMFRALTGRNIHATVASEGDLLVRMATERAPLLASVAPGVPGPIAKVVDRALELDPARRYPDAATMRSDLLAAREGKDPPYASVPPSEAPEQTGTAELFIPPAWASGGAPANAQGSEPPSPEEKPSNEVGTRADTPNALAQREPTVEPEFVSSIRSRPPESVERWVGSTQLRTVSARAKRWAPVTRVLYSILGIVLGIVGIVLMLTFAGSKATGAVLVLMLMLASFPSVVGAILLWRAVESHRRLARPTDEAVAALLDAAFEGSGRISPAEVSGTSGVPLGDIADAVEGLLATGACRRIRTEEGHAVVEFLRIPRDDSRPRQRLVSGARSGSSAR